MKRSTLIPAGIIAALLCLWLTCKPAARADDVQVTAAVSDESTDVGASIDYTITVNGATDGNVPENINVDGLTITYVGPNTQVSIGNMFGSGSHVQRSVIHTFSVTPGHAGDFTIPSQQVVVDGKIYTTRPVSFKVGGSGSASSGDGGGDQIYMAEFVLPSTSAYIGEAIPLEMRLYVDARIPAQVLELPDVTADGCTLQKVTKPAPSQVERNGHEYNMVTYKTAVTAARAGKVTLGPGTIPVLMRIPEKQTRRRFPGSPFQDPFFQNMPDPFQMMTQPKQIAVKADPVELNIKPLPAQGQPASFAGAVGTFAFSSSAKPQMVEAGDPITVTMKISGRGDFDRVTAPQISDAAGWKTYPPSGKFEADDDVGISGSKTFQMAVIAQAKKTASPSVEWSYFDPIKEQYVTLKSEGTPIKIEGEPAASVTPVIAAVGSATPTAQATPTPGATDFQYIRADSSGWGETFAPIYTSRIFWGAQGAPLLALVAFVGVQVSRKRAADEAARRRAQWRREQDAELAELEQRDLPEGELWEAAARVLRLEAAMQTLREPDTLDAAEVAGARELDAATAQRVRELFDRQAEVLYAGTGGGRTASSSQARVELLETVKGYENAKPAA